MISQYGIILLGYFCFHSIISKFYLQDLPKYPIFFPNITYPFFVTLMKDNHTELRGCIGTFENASLSTELHKIALKSAFSDHRFYPLKYEELDDLSIEISLLYDFKLLARWDDWIPGVHGIKIIFEERGNELSSTFLPHVPIKNNMTKEDTIQQLILKAGSRRSFKSLINNIKVISYLTMEKYCTYKDYLEFIKMYPYIFDNVHLEHNQGQINYYSTIFNPFFNITQSKYK